MLGVQGRPLEVVRDEDGVGGVWEASLGSLAVLSLRFFRCSIVKTLNILPRSSLELDTGLASTFVTVEICSR